MSSTINTIPEAQAELARLMESAKGLQGFFERFSGLLNQFETLRGGAVHPGATKLQTSGEAQAGVVGGEENTTPGTSELSLWERVLSILQGQPEKPLMPKEVFTIYKEKAFPMPQKGDPYNAIAATMNYLKKKQLLERVEGGYALTEQGKATTIKVEL